MMLPQRILFIGAHCDDIELFAGGLLAHACFHRRTIGVLVFSDHRGIIDDVSAATAYGEFQENMAWLRKETGALIHDHSQTMLPACQGAFQSQRASLYAAMEALRQDYDLVVTHAATDTNQDHRQVVEEAARVFKAHASLLGGEFPNNDIGDFTPLVYVALSAREVEAKVHMVGHYRSQDFGGRPYLNAEVLRSLTRVRGAQIREVAAEAFSIVGRVVLRQAR